MDSTPIAGLKRICEEYGSVFRIKRESVPSPSSSSATANSASASERVSTVALANTS